MVLKYKSTSGSGLFANCAKRLQWIIDYILLYKKLPVKVHDNKGYAIYKSSNIPKESYSVAFYFFNSLVKNKINKYEKSRHFKSFYKYISQKRFSMRSQYSIYKSFSFSMYQRLIQIYFKTPKIIENYKKNIETKYLIDYNNTCVLFHRGNDKITETKICSYEEQYQKALKIYNANNKIQFLIQSDETEFIEFMISKFPFNSFYFRDEILHKNKSKRIQVIRSHSDLKEKIIYSQLYFAITIIMSKCSHIICGSGNCDFWILMFRGHSRNVIQYLKGKWQ